MSQQHPHVVEQEQPHRPSRLMQVGYWIFLLLVLVVAGEFTLVFMKVITGDEARNLFFAMGLPLLVLLGCVLGTVIADRHHDKRL